MAGLLAVVNRPVSPIVLSKGEAVSDALIAVLNSADLSDSDGSGNERGWSHGDGPSRYGRSLERNADKFYLEGRRPTRKRNCFAAASFTCAMAPWMDPPYVRGHRRVLSLRCRCDESGAVWVAIDIAMPLPDEVAIRVPFADLVGWQPVGRDGEGLLQVPEGGSAVVACMRLHLGLPVPVELLPIPRYRGPGPDLGAARNAVRCIANYANVTCEQLLGDLDV